MGEAANRVSATTRQKYPDILWPEMIGIRNRLIYGYDVIDWNLLWDTVKTDLPPLIGWLQRISEAG